MVVHRKTPSCNSIIKTSAGFSSTTVVVSCANEKGERLTAARQATAGRALTSGTPKIFEPLLAQFGVAGGVLDRAMTKPILNCSCVMPGVGQRVAAGVPQHVDVNLKREARTLADALDQAIDSVGGEWGAALSLEHIAAAGLAL